MAAKTWWGGDQSPCPHVYRRAYIWYPRTKGSHTSGSHGQIRTKYTRYPISVGTKYIWWTNGPWGPNAHGDQMFMRTKCPGDHFTWVSNVLGTICPEVLNFGGTFFGDQISEDETSSGPNVSQPTFKDLLESR